MMIETYLVALAIVGIVDAISYMIVTPSLIFYVLDNGGTHYSYGIIMSVFSLSSFCCKPIVGSWSDQAGFRRPYFVSLTFAILGGLIYVLASALPSSSLSSVGPPHHHRPTAAICGLFLARLLGGCGGGNSALGYAYTARTVPPQQQTSVNSLLSLCRIMGMAFGPAINLLVEKVNLPLPLFLGATRPWKLDKLNSVGVILMGINLCSLLAIYFFLEEPNDKEHTNTNKKVEDHENRTATTPATTILEDPSSASSNTTKWEAIRAFVLTLDIMLPMLCIFTINANWQLVETALAPAAFDGLGWGPVQTGAALGSLSVIMAMTMLAVSRLSSTYQVADTTLLCWGLWLFVIAHTLLYVLWIKETTLWNFYLPVALNSIAFPFTTATNRSLFTVAINAQPVLAPHQGTMQAVLSMAASVAGFTTPSFVAALCLRPPADVATSTDQRELTPYALVGPLLSSLVLVGIGYLHVTGNSTFATKSSATPSTATGTEDDDDDSALITNNESSSLLPIKQTSTKNGIK